MSDWFERLSADNTAALNALRKINAEEWLRRSAVEKYAEATHFIFELLQNADDQEARKVEFTFFPDRVEFCHWGNPFKRENVERITRLGDSDKRGDIKKIGCFGIGFKSVFAITERPEIYCHLDGRPFAFAIHDLIVPIRLKANADQGSETRFILKYAASKAEGNPSADAAEQLRKAGPETLMFINHVEELVWRDHTGNGEWFRCVRRKDGIRTLERAGIAAGELVDPKSSLFRVFHRDITLPDGAPSDVRIAFKLDDSGKVVAEEPPQKLWVFFETEEATGLRFRMHGPFKLTDNRANMMRKEPFNRLLIAELAILAAASLIELKEEGRLARDSLNVLPLPPPTDTLPEEWEPIARAMWQVAKTEAVIPKASDGYGCVEALVQGPGDLRATFDDDDLAALFGGKEIAWSVSAGKEYGRIDRLLAHLGVAKFGVEELKERLEEGFDEESDLANWLSNHDDEWMLRLYQLLNGLKPHQVSGLRQVALVRVSGGEHVFASYARFAPAEDRRDPEVSVEGLRLVSSALLSAGRNKSRREEAIGFLRRIGVKEIGERDYVRALLAKHYRPGSAVSEMKSHLRHVERFAAWLSGHSHDVAIFRGFNIFLCDSSSELLPGTDLYIDKPFLETSLTAIFGPEGPLAGKRKPMAKRYRGIKEVAALARALGATTRLEPEKSTVQGHPESSWFYEEYWRNGSRWGNGTNVDWKFSGIKDLLVTHSLEVSLCLWRTLQALPREKLFARFRHAERYSIRERPASFIYDLRAIEWIPDRTGTFRKPEDVTEADLPQGFDKISDETGWLDAIGFGTAVRRRSAEFQERHKAAARAGIPQDFADRWMALSEEERRTVLEAGLKSCEDAARHGKPDFPERESPNPARRAAKVAQGAAEAPEKRHEVRERTVHVAPPGLRDESRTYLLDLYTNDEGQMVCQCCHDEMPFCRLTDGKPHFDAVQFDQSCGVELLENRLALCPVCAAKYRYARTTTDAELRRQLANSGTLEVKVTLAENEETLKFVGVHKTDIVAALGAIRADD